MGRFVGHLHDDGVAQLLPLRLVVLGDQGVASDDRSCSMIVPRIASTVGSSSAGH
jgi:hypothetical protein